MLLSRKRGLLSSFVVLALWRRYNKANGAALAAAGLGIYTSKIVNH